MAELCFKTCLHSIARHPASCPEALQASEAEGRLEGLKQFPISSAHPCSIEGYVGGELYRIVFLYIVSLDVLLQKRSLIVLLFSCVIYGLRSKSPKYSKNIDKHKLLRLEMCF